MDLCQHIYEIFLFARVSFFDALNYCEKNYISSTSFFGLLFINKIKLYLYH